MPFNQTKSRLLVKQSILYTERPMTTLDEVSKTFISLIDRMHETGPRSIQDQAPDASPGAIRVMQYVKRHPGAGILEVSRGTGLAKPTVSLLAKAMLAKGILSKEAQHDDGRRICLSLTEEGLRAHRASEAYRTGMARTILSALDDEERTTMSRLMASILEKRRDA